jgi:hypothetical protein
VLISRDRLRAPRAITRSTSAACRRGTTRSLRLRTGSTRTASTTSIGAQIPRRSRSTCTAWCTCRNRRRHRTRWRRRVSLPGSGDTGHILMRAVKQMSELVAQVKDEQSYIVVRERIHRNTAESTNARIKWWSIFQLLVLTGQGFFQVWWLKRFFEVSPSNQIRGEGRRLTAAVGQARRVRIHHRFIQRFYLHLFGGCT